MQRGVGTNMLIAVHGQKATKLKTEDPRVATGALLWQTRTMCSCIRVYVGRWI